MCVIVLICPVLMCFILRVSVVLLVNYVNVSRSLDSREGSGPPEHSCCHGCRESV